MPLFLSDRRVRPERTDRVAGVLMPPPRVLARLGGAGLCCAGHMNKGTVGPLRRKGSWGRRVATGALGTLLLLGAAGGGAYAWLRATSEPQRAGNADLTGLGGTVQVTPSSL